MQNNMRNLAFMALFSALIGCSSHAENQLTVSGLAFYNDSNETIENVTLKVTETGKMVSCTLLEPKRYCATGFPQTHYKNAKLSLNWQVLGNHAVTNEVVFTKPASIDSDISYIAVIKFNSSTGLDAFFTKNPRPF
ncbi:hypothetical protein [Pseudoalteromonas spongiae]|uniref:hypothetical protein n=1 Tax=Pseudoalteromonas spongiae TaxID=298657 RepID=UPI0012732637|nr:hypothetical protein [Pseudoalteromonas spongiae]TMO86434.1 hypothetical protein CWC15_06315 [Pseudoalteromonas spongiae]